MTDLEIPVCWGCVVGLHHECYDPQSVETDGNIVVTGTADDEPFVELFVCCCSLRPAEVEPGESIEKRGVGRPVKELSEITDITSTGRKRAAMLYPIFPGMTCEWAWLKRAGGGIAPIVGCAGNKIHESRTGSDRGDRHHGPSKNVLNNSPGNLHRICTFCHATWHQANDRYYSKPRPPADQEWLPDPQHGISYSHDPQTFAAEDEVRAAYAERGWDYPEDAVHPGADGSGKEAPSPFG